jgi:uncharacterized membrane protein YuzA (DUF378 family)
VRIITLRNNFSQGFLLFEKRRLAWEISFSRCCLFFLYKTGNRNFAPQNWTKQQKGMVVIMFNKIALTLLIIGGLNWGLVGLFNFDLVAWLFGGAGAVLSRTVYVLVALSAIWCISLLFKDFRRFAESRA